MCVQSLLLPCENLHPSPGSCTRQGSRNGDNLRSLPLLTLYAAVISLPMSQEKEKTFGNFSKKKLKKKNLLKMKIINSCKEVPMTIFIDGLQSRSTFLCVSRGKHGSKARVRHCPTSAGERLSLDASPSSCLQRYCAMQPKRLHFLELIKPFKSCLWAKAWVQSLPKVVSDCIRLYSIKGSCARRKELFPLGSPWYYPYILQPRRLIASVVCLKALFHPQFPACGIYLDWPSLWYSAMIMHESSFCREYHVCLSQFLSGFPLFQRSSHWIICGDHKKRWGLPKDHPQCLWIELPSRSLTAVHSSGWTTTIKF